MKYLALDIGGANIKAADGEGYASVYPFALWKSPKNLPQELRTVIAEAPLSDHLVVTMTGELADCFANRAEGVAHIIAAVEAAADRRHTRVYQLNGKMVAPQIALRKPHLAAAANWNALGRFACRFAPAGTALLIDSGSTTVDIVPLTNGALATSLTNDTERLLAGELVYSGVERSPVCALLSTAPYRQGVCPLAQELFATMRDVYIVLGDLPEAPADDETADGRPATRAHARQRLARMLCADDDQFNHRDAVVLAQAAAEAQAKLVAHAVQQVAQRLPEPPRTLIFSGHGDFLVRRAIAAAGLQAETLFLARKIGWMPSRCATAHALAVLAREGAGL